MRWLARAMIVSPVSSGWRSASTPRLEFRQLVEEQHAQVREAHLARPRARAAADQRRHAGGMVRRAERALRRQLAAHQLAGEAVHHRDVEHFLRRQWRQDRRQARRQHRFAGADMLSRGRWVKPRAYSYLRFSTPEQQRGDSFRRQKELAERYAAAEGLELDDRSFQDLGVSAFRGKNAASGMLRTFLEAVEEGTEARGSYLLVESLDRLSRAATRKALRQLEDICDAGIVVITLTDGKRYDADTLERDPMSIIVALVVMMRAHEESAMKSGRLKAAWKAK